MDHDVADLSAFFDALETNFPLSGVRESLSKMIGRKTVDALERAGLLTFLRASDRYPCPSPGGTDCPRQVILHSAGGRITAVCGNDPPECDDINLTAKDIELIGVVPQGLCEALRGPLLFGGKTEILSGLLHVFRAGTYQPRPGSRKAIYFAARHSANEYSILLEFLRSRHVTDGFALIVPTDRFVSDETIRESAACGIVVLPLAGIVCLDTQGRLSAKADVTELFAGIGRIGPGPIVPAGAVCAQVFTRDRWQNLDEAGYRELVRNAERYDIFADELTKEVRKRATGKTNGRKAGSMRRSNVSASYFHVIRKALATQGYFDPTGTEENESAKQIFQRARPLFDIKEAGDDGKSGWKLFKTVMVDKHSVYQFKPDEGITFALIFLPKA